MSLQSNSELDEIEKVLFSLENNPKMPDNIFDTTPPDQSEKKDDGNEDDDDIEVVKADIYKFHGQEVTNLDQQVSEGILKFEYRCEDPLDDDIIEIEEVEGRRRTGSSDVIHLDNEEEEEQDKEEVDSSPNKIVICEKSGIFVPKSQIEDDKNKKEEEPPLKKKKIKQFNNGNFFMLAE